MDSRVRSSGDGERRSFLLTPPPTHTHTPQHLPSSHTQVQTQRTQRQANNRTSTDSWIDLNRATVETQSQSKQSDKVRPNQAPFIVWPLYVRVGEPVGSLNSADQSMVCVGCSGWRRSAASCNVALPDLMDMNYLVM